MEHKFYKWAVFVKIMIKQHALKKKLTCADLNNPMNVRMLNDQVMQLEKIFLTPKPGLPLDFTNSTKHIILSYGVGGGFENYGKGGFQLEFLSISRVINHMTCYNLSALIGWNYSFQTGEQIL